MIVWSVVRLYGWKPQTLTGESEDDHIVLYNSAGNLMFKGTRWLLNQCFARGWFE